MVTRLLPRAAAPPFTVLIAVLLALAGTTFASAQTRPLMADEAFHLTATRAADGTLSLLWRIAPGTYLYRDSLKAQIEGAAVSLTTAAGQDKDDPNFGPVEIYHGHAEARAAGLPARGEVSVSFQGCAEAGICYPMVTRLVDLATLAIAAPPPTGMDATAASSAEEQPATAAPVAASRIKERLALMPPSGATAHAAGITDSGTTGTGAKAAGTNGTGTDGIGAKDAGTAAEETAGSILGGGLGAPLVAFFGFGLLLAFTPCVFPMLPVLSGILAGGGAKPTPLRGFALSGTYGLAMAAAYGVLGLVAAWSGANLQAALQTPWALGLMAMLFLGLAASMFGLFELAVPAGLAARLGRGAGGSIGQAATLGFGSALVVGPCVTPPLAGAMLYAAQTGDAARGGAALFLLGLGMSVPLIAVGTFGAQILPRSGPWLVRAKQACGVLFLAVAALLAGRVLPAPVGVALWGALALGLGVFLGGFDRMARRSPPTARLGKAAGLLAALYGAVLVVGAAGGADDPLRPLGFLAAPPGPLATAAEEVRVSSPAALDAAFAETRTSGRPVLVSFTAGWCTVCKSNEAVMTEPEVRQRLAQVPRIAADVTNYGAGEQALMSRYSVVGPPTLFLLDAAGREVPGSRHIGAITRADLDGLMAKAGL
ncbi:MAG TPA: protein-disulfide reductase DsbD [Xanthobacteraceae bacterium]|jgi:thiol:disulfide interchange protein DsbD|nr:protein-disulfide reductase DsbD [Xanthobacteraceae bacterium]HQS49042.1 protein-disulfide reductase DsbD [Xanthobacteraceae bacterium]